jgi:geranylgeranyl pyrophosphate synthase
MIDLLRQAANFRQRRTAEAPASPSASPTLSASKDAARLTALLRAEFALRWPDGTTGLDAVHYYALNPTGKLLRPLLMVRSALTVGGDLFHVLPAAVGIECVHVGSLMHDDIIDHDSTRRGRPAVHTKFGHKQAIVAGNALYFSWFAGLAECSRRGIPSDRIACAMAVQADSGIGACRGAFDELTMAGDLDRPAEAYLTMAGWKTGVLMEASCRIGAILGGGDDSAVDLLGTFGYHLGVAFQIRDDLLPYDTATAGVMGKPGDSDLRNHRPTLPVLLAYQRADMAGRDAIRHALLDDSDPHAAFGEMRVLLETTGALAAAHAMADQFAQRARKALTELPPSPQLEPLSEMTRRL